MAAHRKELREYAKQLTRISLDAEGRVSAERVEAVLEALRKDPPRHFRAILKEYATYIERAIRRTHAVVEYAGAVDQPTLDSIAKKLSDQYGYAIDAESRENLDLIAGLRILIADDVYDASVRGRLNQLNALHA